MSGLKHQLKNYHHRKDHHYQRLEKKEKASEKPMKRKKRIFPAKALPIKQPTLQRPFMPMDPYMAYPHHPIFNPMAFAPLAYNPMGYNPMSI